MKCFGKGEFPMGKLRVAILGTGNIAAKAHLPAFMADERVEIAGLCNRHIERARAMALSCGNPPVFEDYVELLEKIKPDVVSVCFPNNLHYVAVKASLESGAHVLCEKPPTIKLSEAIDLEKSAKEKNLMLAYNLHWRASAEARLLLDIAAKGDTNLSLGKVYAAETKYLRRRGIPGWGSFTDKEIQGGGALIDVGVHCLDLAWLLMGRPKPLYCVGATFDTIGKRGGTGALGQWSGEKFEVDDAAFGFIRFEGGSCLSVQTAWAINQPEGDIFSIRLYGDRAGASLFPLSIHGERGGVPFDMDFPGLFKEKSYLYESTVKAFLDGCEGKGEPLCPAHDGTVVQAMLEALYESASSGRECPVTVDR
jgi:predicted dehydrogenase